MDEKRKVIKIDFDKLEKVFPDAEFNIYPGVAEPGYDDKVCITADWNRVSDKVFDAFLRQGIACEWLDEWTACDSCYKVVRTEPNSYSWLPSYVWLNDGFVCLECLESEVDDYYESLQNDASRAVTRDIAERYPLEDHGYTLFSGDFANGFYPGQNDNPKTILESAIKTNPDDRFVFVISGKGQFDISFELYKLDSDDDDESDEQS